MKIADLHEQLRLQEEAEERAAKEQAERELRESLEALHAERARIDDLRNRLVEISAAVMGAEKDRDASIKRKEGFYASIQKTLEDPAIAKALAKFSIEVKTVEDALAHEKFQDDPDVVGHNAEAAALADAEHALLDLQNGEWTLHAEIRAATMNEDVPQPAELINARKGSFNFLEAHIARLDRGIREFELKTPEGKERGEGELRDIFIKEWDARVAPKMKGASLREIEREMLSAGNPEIITPAAAELRDALGEEKFQAILEGVYAEKSRELGELYRKELLGADAYDLLKLAREYPESETAAQRELSEMYAEGKRTTEALKAFFASPDGRDALLVAVRVSQKRKMEAELADNSQARSASDRDAITKRWEKRFDAAQEDIQRGSARGAAEKDRLAFEAYVDEAAVSVDTVFTKLAARFSFNEGEEAAPRGKNKNSSGQDFDAILRDAWKIYSRRDYQYENLPDLALVRQSIAESRDLQKRLAELIATPDKMIRMFGLAATMLDQKGNDAQSWSRMESAWSGRGTDSRRELLSSLMKFMPKTAVMKKDAALPHTIGERMTALREKRFTDVQLRQLQKKYDAVGKWVEEMTHSKSGKGSFARERAAADIALADKAAFESSPEKAVAEEYEGVLDRNSVGRRIMRDLIPLEIRFSGKEYEPVYFSNGGLIVQDDETVQLEEKVRNLRRDSIEPKERELRELAEPEQAGFGSRGRHADWEEAKKALDGQLAAYKADQMKWEGEIRSRKPVIQALEEAKDLIHSIRQMAPAAFAKADFGAMKTRLDLLDKLRELGKSFSAETPSAEQSQAAEKYRHLKENAQRRIEAATSIKNQLVAQLAELRS